MDAGYRGIGVGRWHSVRATNSQGERVRVRGETSHRLRERFVPDGKRFSAFHDYPDRRTPMCRADPIRRRCWTLAAFATTLRI